MVQWIKDNVFNIINLLILVYVIIELQNIKSLTEETNQEAVLNNVKLDFVESDINTKYIKDTAEEN